MGVFFISMMIVVRIAFCELRERAEAGVLLFIIVYQDIWDKSFESKSPSCCEFEANLYC